MSAANTKGADPNAKLRGYMVIMDSMTAEELDTPELWKTKTKEARVRRLARGSGKSLRDVDGAGRRGMEGGGALTGVGGWVQNC